MNGHLIKSPRKLIEVALPLDAINEAAAREKSIRHGHPSTLHLWWARRPLAAARAVIFAQMVNDPGYQQGDGFKYGMNKKDAARERKRLFKIIEDLVLWENTSNEEVLDRARAEIRRSWREVCDLNKDHPQAAELFNSDKLPAFHDPFAGGGAIPLEAQRLGLEAYASDINPVAVLLNKAMIEIPPAFAGYAPVNPEWQRKSKEERGLSQWKSAQGLAADVRYYGKWMRDEAEKRIGQLYPLVEITASMAKDRSDLKPLVGQKLTVIAWLWTRTVQCPNPACRARTPLARSFWLSEKHPHRCFTKPILNTASKTLRFAIATTGEPPQHTTDRTGARCLFCDTPINKTMLRRLALENGVPAIPLAVVAEGPRARVYLETEGMELPDTDRPTVPFLELPIPNDRRWFSPPLYGLTKYCDLFTSRQLTTLITITQLVGEAIKQLLIDSSNAGLPDEDPGLDAKGKGHRSYAEAVGVYLACAASKSTVFLNTLSRWRTGEGKTAPAFGRQAMAMVWDYAEVNPFAGAGGDFLGIVEGIARTLESFSPKSDGNAEQNDAQHQQTSFNKVVSTDPPYYDNIGYADLSEFFYIWLRQTMRPVFPSIFSTITVPKAPELAAIAYRHGGAKQAEAFFLKGMTTAMSNLAVQTHPGIPLTLYYAFKQAETDSDTGTVSTGWETFLEAVNSAGLQLVGTWPMRTENATRMIGAGTNSLASSIVLVCRKRSKDAATVSRREFLRELNIVLPEALDEMTKGTGDERSPVAPVDLSQAILGPGMAVFSKYGAVLEADGTPMSVRTALQLINRFLAEDDFDHDTQFCLHWFEQHGWGEGAFGEADVLARAKGTSVEGVKDAGVIRSGAGKVRLLKWAEYPADWNPSTDARLPVWEALHQIIRAFRHGGDSASGTLLAALGGKAEAVRQLSYRLYTLCERLGQAEDARAYNEVITSWSGIETAAASAPRPSHQELPGFER
jgi:putative DNA methylase